MPTDEGGLVALSSHRRDPTRTTMLRKRFESALVKRFRQLRRVIRISIQDQDALALRPPERRPVLLEAIPAGPRRFDFPRSDQKIAEFMRWLREQIEAGILETAPGTGRRTASSTRWTDLYIRAAYRRGRAQARARLGQFGIELGAEDPVDPLRLPIHADRVGLLFTRTFTELRGITEAMASAISRELAEGMARGEGPIVIARRIAARVDKVGITRARTLARTEIIRAHAEAALNTYQEAGLDGVRPLVEFSTAGDDRVCQICQGLEGKIFTLDEARGVIPVHPNCLPGDALVAAEGISAASERWYEGDMIILRTAGDKQVSCTPNHPILTANGWVAAGLLNKGDYVVGCGGRQRITFVNHHGQYMPARIEEVAEALGRAVGMSPVKVPVAAPDFHGDGVGSEVAIIWADSLLVNDIDASFLKQGAQLPLSLGDVQTPLLPGYRSPLQFLGGSLSTADRCVRCGGPTAPFLWRGIRHQGRHGLAPPTDGYTPGLESAEDSRSADAVFLGQGFDRGALAVTVSQFFDRNALVPGERGSAVWPGYLNPGGVQPPGDRLDADAELARNLLAGVPAPVFLDEVIDIQRKPFRGHVYNLQTRHGYFTANSIITHNCRCTWIPAMVGERPEERGQRRAL